jgi:hypothetical protein
VTTVNFGQILKDAKSASFEALPIGDYDVETEKSEAVQSSNGRPMIKTTFKVIVGPHTNRKVMNNFVLVVDNPVALAIFFRNMKCFGLEDNFFAALGDQGSLDVVANAMIGKRVRLTLGQREWQGEMRNEVKQVKPYTGAPGGMGGGPAAGPTPGMTGVPGPSPAAYGAVPTPGPIANTPAQVMQQHAPLATAPAPQPTPVAQPQPVSAPEPVTPVEVPAAPQQSDSPAPPAPPELPI